MRCAFCRKELKIDGPVGKEDTCPHCHRNLRCCRQCRFYDPNAYNECREVSAERIGDKERANQCDHFVIKGRKGGRRSNRVTEAKEALEALFKKK